MERGHPLLNTVHPCSLSNPLPTRLTPATLFQHCSPLHLSSNTAHTCILCHLPLTLLTSASPVIYLQHGFLLHSLPPSSKTAHNCMLCNPHLILLTFASPITLFQCCLSLHSLPLFSPMAVLATIFQCCQHLHPLKPCSHISHP